MSSERGIVYTREDTADRIKQAADALGDIMLSSAYSSHHDPEVSHIVDFEEFSDVYNKIMKWHIEFDKVIKKE